MHRLDDNRNLIKGTILYSCLNLLKKHPLYVCFLNLACITEILSHLSSRSTVRDPSSPSECLVYSEFGEELRLLKITDAIPVADTDHCRCPDGSQVFGNRCLSVTGYPEGTMQRMLLLIKFI